MVDWKPILKDDLRKRIAQGAARMKPEERRLWNLIRIDPEKWQQKPFGTVGGGFWVVGIIGRTVVWYNDIEEGFNRSIYSSYGEIEDYWRNSDELDVTIQYLRVGLERGADLIQIIRTRRG